MTLLLLSALLATLAAVFVIRPIVSRRAAVLTDAAPGALLDAEARRRMALASLKELEYDFLGGKLDDADYQAQRERLSHEALEAIRAADAAQAAAAGEAPSAGSAAPAMADAAHGCGFANPPGSRFCAGCGKRL
ncbi:MAG TPA: zinc ribbon domain-containing protein [Longimicrobiaceae bacterium]|nr:zinc ribbon domain-containing protein [Longimicrobiaceae bacterium]